MSDDSTLIPELLEIADDSYRVKVGSRGLLKTKASCLAVASIVAPVLRTNAAKSSARRVLIVNDAGDVVEESSLARVQEALCERAGIELDVADEHAAKAERVAKAIAATACKLCGKTSEERAGVHNKSGRPTSRERRQICLPSEGCGGVRYCARCSQPTKHYSAVHCSGECMRLAKREADEARYAEYRRISEAERAANAEAVRS